MKSSFTIEPFSVEVVPMYSGNTREYYLYIEFLGFEIFRMKLEDGNDGYLSEYVEDDIKAVCQDVFGRMMGEMLSRRLYATAHGAIGINSAHPDEEY